MTKKFSPDTFPAGSGKQINTVGARSFNIRDRALREPFVDRYPRRTAVDGKEHPGCVAGEYRAASKGKSSDAATARTFPGWSIKVPAFAKIR